MPLPNNETNFSLPNSVSWVESIPKANPVNAAINETEYGGRTGFVAISRPIIAAPPKMKTSISPPMENQAAISPTIVAARNTTNAV